MAVSPHGEAVVAASGGDDADFVRDSYLAYMVPLATDSKLEQALETRDGSLQSFIESIEDREWLFFDETVDVYFILRTPHQTEQRLRTYLDRLAVALEVKILNHSQPGRESSSPVVEVIFSGAVENANKPLAVVHDPEVGESEDDDDDDDEEEDDDDDSEEEEEEEDDDDDEEDKETKASQKRATRGGGAHKKEKDDRPVRQTYLVWKLPVFLARPRARLQGPSVSFAAVATLGPPGSGGGTVLANGSAPLHPPAGYLRSREPSGLNLLASFVGDPALAGVRPRLSAQRVARVAPAGLMQQQQQQAARNQTRALRGQPHATVPIFPAVHARVRFARPNAVPASAAVVALLEIDCTPFFECEAVLTRIDLALRPGGTVTDLHSDHGLGLPLYCVARDHFTFLYHLAPEEVVGGGGGSGSRTTDAASARDLLITVELQALVKPGVCTPTMKLSWTTGVDFVLPVNPGFGSAVPPASLQRAHRPSQLSIDGMASFVAPAVSRPDSLQMVNAGVSSSTMVAAPEGTASSGGKKHAAAGSLPAPLALAPAVQRSVEAHLPDLGITMTFSAPDRPVYAGEPFSWTVFVVNRSGSAASVATAADGTALAPPTPLPPRKLALLVLPKRRRNDVRVLRPPSTRKRRSTLKGRAGPGDRGGGGGGSPSSKDASGETDDVADAVLDENIVHAMQRSSLVGSTDVVSVTADARVGPLAPNACHSVELRFVALRAGLVSIEAVRVVDLGSQEHVDVRELPVMMIAEGRRPEA